MRFQSIPKIAQFICTLLVVYMAFYGIAQATMAPAGIDINNTATSEYNDAGQNKTSKSNTVTIKVLPVFLQLSRLHLMQLVLQVKLLNGYIL